MKIEVIDFDERSITPQSADIFPHSDLVLCILAHN